DDALPDRRARAGEMDEGDRRPGVALLDGQRGLRLERVGGPIAARAFPPRRLVDLLRNVGIALPGADGVAETDDQPVLDDDVLLERRALALGPGAQLDPVPALLGKVMREGARALQPERCRLAVDLPDVGRVLVAAGNRELDSPPGRVDRSAVVEVVD